MFLASLEPTRPGRERRARAPTTRSGPGVLGRILKLLLKRRQVIVSGVQYRLMLTNFLSLVAIVLIFVPAIFVPQLVAPPDPAQLQPPAQEAARQLPYAQLWIAVPVIFLLCLAHSLVVSHRVAGPLHRLCRIVRLLADGDLTPAVRIRRGDYLWDEARALDEMIGKLSHRVGAIRDTYDEAAATLPRLVEAVGSHDRRDSVVLAGKLAAQLDFLGREIAAFKLPPRQAAPAAPGIAPVPREIRDAPTSTAQR